MVTDPIQEHLGESEKVHDEATKTSSMIRNKASKAPSKDPENKTDNSTVTDNEGSSLTSSSFESLLKCYSDKNSESSGKEQLKICQIKRFISI